MGGVGVYEHGGLESGTQFVLYYFLDGPHLDGLTGGVVSNVVG